MSVEVIDRYLNEREIGRMPWQALQYIYNIYMAMGTDACLDVIDKYARPYRVTPDTPRASLRDMLDTADLLCSIGPWSSNCPMEVLTRIRLRWGFDTLLAYVNFDS